MTSLGPVGAYRIAFINRPVVHILSRTTPSSRTTLSISHPMSENRLDTLSEVFAAVFELDPEVDVRSVSQEATEAWDSLAHVSLMTALESEFDVEITAADSIEMSSFEAVAEILDELLAE